MTNHLITGAGIYYNTYTPQTHTKPKYNPARRTKKYKRGEGRGEDSFIPDKHTSRKYPLI